MRVVAPCLSCCISLGDSCCGTMLGGCGGGGVTRGGACTIHMHMSHLAVSHMQRIAFAGVPENNR